MTMLKNGFLAANEPFASLITFRKRSSSQAPQALSKVTSSYMLVGYMRVSSESDRQTTDLQRDALLAAGVDSRNLFEDHASGAKDDRPGLISALAFVRPGDVLVVWKLDRLGRSLSHLLTIINSLRVRNVAFRSLTEGMDTTTASGEL